jgi:hypothetical protein
VRLYDVESGELKKVLEGPTGGVISVHNDTHYLAAGSMDRNIVSLSSFIVKVFELTSCAVRLGHQNPPRNSPSRSLRLRKLRPHRPTLPHPLLRLR